MCRTRPRDQIRSWLLVGVLSCGSALAADATPRPEPGAKRPNIIVIVADDLGYAELGSYGGKDVPTPNVDSLAAQGVRFTQGYVSCPVCSPTRAGLMTGRYQQRFGHEFNPGPDAGRFGLPLSETTMADRLKAMGYATGMVGKWHLGAQSDLTPPRRGFDEFYGFLGGAHAYLNLSQGAPILRGGNPVEEREYLTDAFGREAVAFIERHKAEPFFLYLPFNAVHMPLEATAVYRRPFDSLADEKRRMFAAMLAAMDANIGKVLSKLRELKIEEETLIFFISDNGGPTAQTTSSNGPLRGFKGQVWEGGIRVPFIVQWKGRVPAGRVNDSPVIALDIHPTAVAAAGGRIDPAWKFDGVNLLPFLTGRAEGKPHDALYWRFGNQYAVRQGDWKLVIGPGETQPALFNLARDVSEKDDLAAKSPDKLKELSTTYARWSAELARPLWAGRKAGAAARRKTNAPTGPAAAQLPARFKSLDNNGDGKLTPDEYPRPRIFQRLDANGDGALSPAEAEAGGKAGSP